MLMERQAAMKLARKLAQKIGAEPEKFGEIARKAAPAPEGQVCGLHYSPIPLGAAGKALNFMHYAVNGIRPYPEEGGGSGIDTGSTSPQENQRSDGTCVETHQYDPIKCKSLGQYSGYNPTPFPEPCYIDYICAARFVCDDTRAFICEAIAFKGCEPSAFDCRTRFAYGPSPGTPLIPVKCPNPVQGVYTCPAQFSCRATFMCDAVSTSPKFACSDGYDCHVKFGCGAPQGIAFDCPGGGQTYNCQDSFDCSNPFSCRNHDCGTSGDRDYDRFNCVIHGCISNFDCEDHHDCSPPFNCSQSFECGGLGPGDNTNAFACTDGAGSFDCSGDYHCIGIYRCKNTHECPQNYDCGTGSVGFECVNGGQQGFNCDTYNCTTGLDFKCEGTNNFKCNRIEGFTCSAGHVFRCVSNFECSTHTCSAGGQPCDTINNFGGQDGPGVFSCDNAFSGCSQSVDCSGATVGFRCIDSAPYDCNGTAYDCGEKYDSCVRSQSYSDYGNCASAHPGDPNTHGCPDLNTYGCTATDQGGPYDCPATYQMLCPTPPFDRAADP